MTNSHKPRSPKNSLQSWSNQAWPPWYCLQRSMYFVRSLFLNLHLFSLGLIDIVAAHDTTFLLYPLGASRTFLGLWILPYFYFSPIGQTVSICFAATASIHIHSAVQLGCCMAQRSQIVIYCICSNEKYGVYHCMCSEAIENHSKRR